MKRRNLHEIYKTCRAIWLKKLRLAYKKHSPTYWQDKSTSKRGKKKRKRRGKRLADSRQVRIDKELMQAIRRFIQHTSSKGDPLYTSVASFIRSALTEYRQGLSMAPNTEAERQITTVRLDDELNAFWSTLPRGERSDILEEILRVKLGSDSSL